MLKKIINVTCAIIQKGNNILIAQRSELMSNPLKWEFPGGKINNNESAENCILREINEELSIDIKIIEKMKESIYEENERIIILYPFICEIVNGEITLAEHLKIKWEKAENIFQYDLSSADIPVLNNYLSFFNNNEK